MKKLNAKKEVCLTIQKPFQNPSKPDPEEATRNVLLKKGACNLMEKETLVQVFSSTFCEIF